MIDLPFAKVNMGLYVLRLRPDGYRDIASVMWPIPLRDVLELVVDPGLPAGEVVLTRSGLPVPGAPSDDLCMKAMQALSSVRRLPGTRMHLHKAIPLGAGLGGGSSDAAHVLRMGNVLFGLGLQQPELKAMAASLGSDCAFFLKALPQLALGRGELLEPVALNLANCHMLLVNPGIHIPTAEVYAHTPVHPRSEGSLIEALKAPRDRWQQLVVNDLEHHVLQTWPAVATIKQRLLAAGAFFAAMSGSGSSVFGLFEAAPPEIIWPADHRSWTFLL